MKKIAIIIITLAIFKNILCYDKLDNGNNINIDFILKKVQSSSPVLKSKEYYASIDKTEVSKSFKNFVLPPISINHSKDVDQITGDDADLNKFEASMPIFEGGKSYYTYKQNKVKYSISEKEVFLTLLEEQEKAIENYFNILNYQKQIEITDLVISALNNQSIRLTNLFENGQQIAKSEIYKVDADIELNNAINIDNMQKKQDNIESLYSVLGMSLDSNNNFLDFSIDKYLKDKIDYKEDEKRLLNNSTAIKKEKLKVDSAEYDLKIAKSELYPTLSANSKYVLYKDDDDDDEGWMIELGFEWLFAWGGTLDSISQKKKNLEKHKIELEDNIKTLTLKFREQYRVMQSLYGQLLAHKKRIELLEKNLTLDALRYDNQLISTFDYLNSVNELKKSQEEYYKLQRNLVFAIIKYENLAR